MNISDGLAFNNANIETNSFIKEVLNGILNVITFAGLKILCSLITNISLPAEKQVIRTGLLFKSCV